MLIAGDRSQPSSLHRSRRGFTLVELLVVIAIIGVLISLLVVAIGVARASVQEATMVSEVNSLSQALKAFKTQHQTDFPPDFSVQSSNQPDFNLTQINQFMSRMFRYRNPMTDLPRNDRNSDVKPVLLRNLDPSEALWFWLRGFTSDAQNPLFGPLNTNPETVERTPMFEFDKTRLLDLDNDGFLEYYPRFAREQPYLYYVHYNYLVHYNYNKLPQYSNIGAMQPKYRNSTMGQVAAICPAPYLSTLTTQTPESTLPVHYAAPDSFQIICAGMDNDFGPLLTNDTSANDEQFVFYLPYAYPTGPYPNKRHRDNITSFAEKTLEDTLP